MFNNAGIMHPEDDNALNTEERIWYVKTRNNLAYSDINRCYKPGI